MKGCCSHWFLRRVLRQVVAAHWKEILMDRYIPKHDLYREFSQRKPYRKEETREILSLLARTYQGIVYSNRGLWISKHHLGKAPGHLALDERDPKPLTAWVGGA